VPVAVAAEHERRLHVDFRNPLLAGSGVAENILGGRFVIGLGHFENNATIFGAGDRVAVELPALA
jgi:hypothetical protein